MKNKDDNVVIFIFFLLCNISLFAQSKSFKISGTLLTENEKTPLESATIYLERVIDSSLITYTISDKNGRFYLEGKTTDESLNLYISYVGYQTYYRNIILENSEILLSTINLKVDVNALDTIIINTTAPILIKKDTLEYNVKSFKTKKDANIEDLLKELPGIEVDEDGKITVNGKEVNKILVNGKPFFGNDPTITTRNLSKEIIDKVQVTDTKTKAEVFSGERGSKEKKTINLTLNKKNTKGFFGRVAAGVGTNKRNEFASMLNLFNDNQRISFLAGGNNINSPGFSFGEIKKMFGGSNNSSTNGNGTFVIDGRSFGGSEGITTSKNSGINFTDDIGNKAEFTSNYFYSSLNSENLSKTKNEFTFPDSRYTSNQTSNRIGRGNNHNLNTDFDIEVDSTLLINIKPVLSYSKGSSNYFTNQVSKEVDGTIKNSSSLSEDKESSILKFNSQINFTKRYGNKGSFLKLKLVNEIVDGKIVDFFTSEVNFETENSEDLILNQFTNQKQKISKLSASINYRWPIKSYKIFLDFRFKIKKEKKELRKATYDFNNDSQEYSQFNSTLSTNTHYFKRESSPGLKFTYQQEKWFTNFVVDYDIKTLENKDFLRPLLAIKKNFNNFEVDYFFSYRFKPTSSITFNYSLKNFLPKLFQLQSFEDVTNPLNTLIGNPNLEPTNSHRLFILYNSSSFQNNWNFQSHFFADFSKNQVVSKSTINDDLIRETTYVNANGNYNLLGGINYSKKSKLNKYIKIKYKVKLNSSLSRFVNFNNNLRNETYNTNITSSLGVTFFWKNLLDLTPLYKISYTKSKYNIDELNNQKFYKHKLGVNNVIYFSKKLEWRNDINFNYNPDLGAGFQNKFWLWNSTFDYDLLKSKATLSVKAYDILNQNLNIKQLVSSNFSEETQSTILQRYFMLSFSWRFNDFK